MDLLAVGLKQKKLYITKTIFHRNTNIVSECKVLFFLSFVSNFWHVVFTGREWFSSLFQLNVSFSLWLLSNSEDGTLRNLTFFIKFLPLFFLLEKKSLPTHWKETNSRLYFNRWNPLPLSSWKKCLCK